MIIELIETFENSFATVVITDYKKSFQFILIIPKEFKHGELRCGCLKLWLIGIFMVKLRAWYYLNVAIGV